VHLHLEHPFVQRILSRFLAQGYGTHDLARVTALAVPNTGDTFALAVGRLCLFGTGAGRLHDQLLCVAARVTEPDHLSVLDPRESELKLDELERLFEHRPTLDPFSAELQATLVRRASGFFGKLLPALRQEADALAVTIEQKLRARAREESAALRAILNAQRDAIDTALGGKQLALAFGEGESDKKEAEQLRRDKEHLRRRREAVERELESEPRELEQLYEVKLRRLETVGLCILYPELRL
jgi:hypothetical protein